MKYSKTRQLCITFCIVPSIHDRNFFGISNYLNRLKLTKISQLLTVKILLCPQLSVTTMLALLVWQTPAHDPHNHILPLPGILFSPFHLPRSSHRILSRQISPGSSPLLSIFQDPLTGSSQGKFLSLRHTKLTSTFLHTKC